jgi:hypothetical protein
LSIRILRLLENVEKTPEHRHQRKSLEIIFRWSLTVKFS